MPEASIIQQFDRSVFKNYCDELALRDKHLPAIVTQHGYPPMWKRPNRFSTLIHIILEQQVSLASARAAYDRLHLLTGGITPEAVLALGDDELKACYFSRQKMKYARHLASACQSGDLPLRQFRQYTDQQIKESLMKVKGIGEWTADIYLIFALQRSDIFPLGDLAMVKSLREVKQLPATMEKEKLKRISESWRPFRSIATMMLWHHYLSTRSAGRANP